MGFNSHQWYLNGLKKVGAANTFIGGVSSSILTAGDLATRLGILESAISSFEIVNDDIEARVEVDYNMPTNAFKSVNVGGIGATLPETMTYFFDTEQKCTALGSYCFQGQSLFSEVDIKGITSMQDWPFLATRLQQMVFPELTSATQQKPFGVENTAYKTGLIFAPKITTCYASFGNAKVIYAPMLNNLGNPSTNESYFAGCQFGVKIYVDVSLQTINAGAEDADLAWARANKGAQIFYAPLANNGQSLLTPPLGFSIDYTDDIRPNSFRLLGAGTSSNEVVLFREVFVSGVSYGELSSGKRIQGLTQDTAYSVTAIVVDECHNKSILNGTVVFNTTIPLSTDYPTDALAAFFPLNEISGEPMDNWNGNNGVKTGALVQTGDGYDFNGSNTFITVQANADIQASGSMTISARLKSTGSGLRQVCAMGANNSYRWRVQSQKDWALFSSSAGTKIYSSTYVIPLNETHIQAMVLDIEAQQIRWYLDGALIYQIAIAMPNVNPSTSQLFIGAYSFNSEVWLGNMANFAIHKKALSATEVGKLSNNF